MLRFLGIGSAFNTRLGNNSAYIKKDNSLLLIDCGGMVFHKINEIKLLDGVTDLQVMITHTHSDHVASLPEVIFYAYYLLKIQPKVYYPNKKLLWTLLQGLGVDPQMVEIIDNKVNDVNIGLEPFEFEFISVSHLNTVEAYGLLISGNDQTIYYSGDASQIPSTILNELYEGRLDALYQDTCGLEIEGIGHMWLSHLERDIPIELRNKVYCMHLDQHTKIEDLEARGFNVPSVVS